MKYVQRLSGAMVPVIAALGAFAVGALMIWLLGASPLEGYKALLSGAFGGRSELADTAVKSTPLLLVGTGICIAFRARVINVGGEGQILFGALFSTVTALGLGDLPRPVLLPLVLVAGMVGGGFWGAIPGALKAYLGVNEILSTIMLNIVAVQFVTFLLRGPLIDPEQDAAGRIPQTKRLSPNADLPILVDGTRMHLGVLLAVGMAVAAWVFLWRSTVGYRVRAVGAGRDAARYAGIRVRHMTVLALTVSGAMCGLAGAISVFGSEGHRFVSDGSSTGFTGSAGFNGIVAALFGALHPLWTIPASFLFGGLLVGANAMQRAIQIPSSLVVALNGIVVLFVVASVDVRRRLLQRFPAADGTPAPADARAPSVELEEVHA
jgi:simple sugar transport system permease protein